MAARRKNLHLWEAGGQPFDQNGAHHLLGRIVPRVNQIDPQGFGVQEAIILQVTLVLTLVLLALLVFLLWSSGTSL